MSYHAYYLFTITHYLLIHPHHFPFDAAKLLLSPIPYKNAHDYQLVTYW